MIAIVLPLGALTISTLALLLAFATFIRAGDWEKSKAGEAVNGKINELRHNVAGLISDQKHAPTAKETANHEARISVLESRLGDLATRSQVSGLKAEVDGVQSMVRVLVESMKRVEGYMMEADK